MSVATGTSGDVAEVVVVGTGLGSLGAVLALVEAGVVPTVIDVGRGLPVELESVRERMASSPPGRWEASDVALLARNETAGRTGVPRKLVLGSDHFYADDGGAPPHSFALGGFSAGWGGAFLPARQEDLEGWPVPADVLLSHARRAARSLPLSEPVDALSAWFPPLRGAPGPVVGLSAGQRALLDRVRDAAARSGLPQVGAGQSRLLTSVAQGGVPSGDECRRCGYCMSGCVYGSILSAGDVLRRLAAQGRIGLRLGRRVVRFEEHEDHVEVATVDPAGRASETVRCERLLLGAGAVESARIVVRSLAPRTRTVELLRTGGALLPLASLRRIPSDWPETNTQPSVFLEVMDPEVSPHWVHTQIAPANELVLRKLQLHGHGRDAPRARLRWAGFERLAYALVNLHSDHGSRYVMTLEDRSRGGAARTETVYPEDRRRHVRRATAAVRSILRGAGLHSIRPLEQDSADGIGYHLGGSLPMRTEPSHPTETDPAGRPSGSRRVHAIDASVLPSLPGTTIGLLILANAHRIASSLRDEAT